MHCTSPWPIVGSWVSISEPKQDDHVPFRYPASTTRPLTTHRGPAGEVQQPASPLSPPGAVTFAAKRSSATLHPSPTRDPPTALSRAGPPHGQPAACAKTTRVHTRVTRIAVVCAGMPPRPGPLTCSPPGSVRPDRPVPGSRSDSESLTPTRIDASRPHSEPWARVTRSVHRAVGRTCH